jgi:4-amino-4-deoxy-L-arabinose transferase-like glycosyltransferase
VWTRVGASIVIALLVLGAALRVGFSPVRERTLDEFFYTRYVSWLVSHHHDVADLVDMYNHVPEAWQYPSPTRVGSLWIGYGLAAVTGDASATNLARVSIAASILALILTAALAWTRFGPWAATMAVAFLACSPLDLAISRRAWQDAVLAVFTLATVFAYAGAIARPKRAAWWVAFFSIAGYTVLIKESAVMFLALGAVGLAYVRWRDRRRLGEAWPPLAIAVGTLIVTLAVQAMACGGVAPLIEIYSRVFRSGAVNLYMRQNQMGGPELYGRGLAILQPVPFAFGAVAALLVAVRARFVLAPWSRTGRDLLTSLAWLMIVFGGAALVYSQKNMRFLSPIYAPTFLLAGSLVWAVLVSLRDRAPAMAWRAAVGLVALGLVFSGYGEVRRFEHYFVDRGITDLVAPLLEKK